MEKIKHSPTETVKSIIIAVLTLSMLTLSVIYIGGSRFATDNTALSASELPFGATVVGVAETEDVTLYEKNLLPVSYVGIRYGENGGGAYSNEAAAESLLSFAYEYVHLCLESGSTISEVSGETLSAALGGNFLVLNLSSSLPYQIIYALTGEYNSPAGSQTAISADRLVIYEGDGVIKLLLSDGEKVFVSSAAEISAVSELSALASDSRLSNFSVNEYGLATSSATPSVHRITFDSAPTPSIQMQNSIIELFGYDLPEISEREGFANMFSPLGTLQINQNKIGYSSSHEGGIPLSDFLSKSKNDIDIGIYDVLTASLSLLEEVRIAAHESTGAPMELQLGGFYYSGGTYTLIFNLACDGIGAFGEEYPYFAKITASNGRFKSIEIKLLSVQREGYVSPIFPSEFNYNYANQNENVRSIFLKYPVDALPTQSISPMWYYTATGGATK